MLRLLLVTLLTALATVTPSAGAGPAAGPTLLATVSDLTFSLTRSDGSPVTQLPPGPYTIAVDDRSEGHDFMLVGPGVRRFTDYAFVGKVTWQVTLEEGYYHFYCSPHEDTMSGDVVVGSPPAPSVALSVDVNGNIAAEPAQLAPGRYSVGVDDRSSNLNVRLAGPGVDEHTQNHILRQSRWSVNLAAGVYHAYSDRRPERAKQLTVGTPPAPTEDQTLTAVTGPDFAISLQHADSSPVTQIEPGRYTIRVEDTSAVHNFHLNGPGFDRSTTLPFVGSETWELELRRGVHNFFCDPHTQTMTGSFRVGAPPAPRRRLAVSVSAKGALRGPKGTLPAGAYDIRATDRSKKHNLHLLGPGLNKRTGRGFRGTARWAVTLAPGRSFRYRSDAQPKRARTFRTRPAT